jgi:hypothetical protein
MQHAVTVNFIDAESQDEACVIVRYNRECVCVTASLRKDGDLMVCMSKEDAKALLAGLKKATAESDDDH